MATERKFLRNNWADRRAAKPSAMLATCRLEVSANGRGVRRGASVVYHRKSPEVDWHTGSIALNTLGGFDRRYGRRAVAHQKLRKEASILNSLTHWAGGPGKNAHLARCARRRCKTQDAEPKTQNLKTQNLKTQNLTPQSELKTQILTRRKGPHILRRGGSDGQPQARKNSGE
ncbi:MAG TPA: hypothetical protein VH519_11010 [Hyphomicrobiaceae bacterium]